jgi:2-polyprenyl-6-methoxyphenol hydroxylase-like FAD-dependent oxidoreductase
VRVVVVGAGPVGLLCALARARAGDEVTLVEKDPRPVDDWDRRGVMQFRHPHFFRPQVRMVLEQWAPEVWAAVLAAGGVPATIPGMPPTLSGLACRRSVFERSFREVVERDPRITTICGEVEQVTSTEGRVTGVRVGGVDVPADLVLCCTGRTGTLGEEWRPPSEGGPCGQSYVSRMYRAVDGVDPFGESHFPKGELGPGYLTIAFPQDDATLSALVVRPTADRTLAGLRHVDAYDKAVSAIPNLAPWTDPERFTPITDVLVGGLLTNTYRGQVTEQAPSGVVFLGDAVSTTNPSAGRGASLGLLQASAFLELLEAQGPDAARQAFDEWCTANIKPWYVDHVSWDASLLRRFAGKDVDPEGPMTSDLICDAQQADPEIAATAGPFQAMMALPDVLLAAEERARAVYRSGWRAPVSGPDVQELAAIIG